jgi:uncharacterized membrane protein
MNAILLILLIVLVIEVFILRSRVAKLERFREMEAESAAPEDVRAGKAASADLSGVHPEKTAPRENIAPQSPRSPPAPPPKMERVPVAPVRPVFTQAEPSSLERGMAASFEFVRGYFTTGNVVLKVGVVILFIGVAFLLKYTAQRNLIPIELRLAGVAGGGLGLLVAGWISAKKRQGYGLILQGGGVGILYLTVFAASRLYHLLPNTLSFMMMVGVVLFSGILAILQNSRSMAAFGAVGGFIAPVLMSTGTGSHVVLFSYYALLNCGIVGIAWFKAWREINLIGFFFTFVISAFWGYRYYQPQYLSTTEPFLVLFFLLYVAVSILFAHRQPLHLRGFVDGPLVFGLPIVFFGMQASLVENMEYGVALSALGLGIFYIFLASLLWKRMVEGMRTLTEAFLALGVVFGSLAIPFALDGHYTASAWALEGAAMVWVGLRQRRLLARQFGIVLQLGAAASLLLSSHTVTIHDPLFINQVSLSCFFIAVGALFSAFQLSGKQALLRSWERRYGVVLMGWGLLWWFGAGMRDIEVHFSYPAAGDFMLLYLAFSAFLLCLLQRRLPWRELKYPLLGFLPLLVIAAASTISPDGSAIYFEGGGALAWPASFGIFYFVLRSMEDEWPAAVTPWYHLISLWLLLFVLSHDAAWLAERLISASKVWPFVSLALVPGTAILILLNFGSKIRWPIAAFARFYLDHGLAVPLGFLVLWSIASTFVQGDPAPLPHIPLLNPLAVTQIFVFFVILMWHRQGRLNSGICVAFFSKTTFFGLFGALVFLWLNGVTARLISLFFGIPFSPQPLLSSVVFQSALSILWSVAALTLTIWANRRGRRMLWFAGAILLAGVVVKLFLVDLSGTGTIARIVSFIAVGILMLLIGSISPLPPKTEKT